MAPAWFFLRGPHVYRVDEIMKIFSVTEEIGGLWRTKAATI